MAWYNFWSQRKNQAAENNYKLDIFNLISQDTEVANISTIKKYFNSLYDSYNGGINAFSVTQSLDGLYAAESTNKGRRLSEYRSMVSFSEIDQAINMICYSADIPDENNQLVSIKINDPNLDAKDIQEIKECIQKYLDLFDLDNNMYEYFRQLLIDGQLCWENIIAKDDIEQGIIGINLIPNESYEFCYDMKLRKKFGIMITNTAADSMNVANGLYVNNLPGGTVNVGGNYANLNCYQDLLEEKCLVLPFSQLTYIDCGIYNADNKIVYSPLERARRAFNQLKLIEDSILIYRVSRSPEKYVFNVDIGKMNKARGEQKVAQLMKQFGTKKMYDPQTGSVGKTYDPMQMTENFWFVKSADSEGITVNPLQANHNFGNLDDLDYFMKKLYRSLNIPLSRLYGDNASGALINNVSDGGISGDELNFARFIMSLQRRMALGLLDGAITHLKCTGLWDAFNLSRSKIDIIINPPVEWVQYRRQKMLEAKVNMLKLAVGDEKASSAFSLETALSLFMGWDKDQIEENKRRKLNEQIEEAKNKWLISKVEENGSLDFKEKDDEEAKTFKEILQDGLISATPTPIENNKESSESSDEDIESEDLSIDSEFPSIEDSGVEEGSLENEPVEEI